MRSLRRAWRVVRNAAREYGRRYLPNESQHLLALTIAVGVVCGFVAVAFHLAIDLGEHLLIERAMHASSPSWMVWTIATPVLGGLLAGALLTFVVPGARGSGIPQVKQAFAMEGGRVRFRDAFGKFFLSSMQIGSGAALGREGPTVQICAGAASLLARATSLPPRNMRRLMPVGVAAGIAAAFNAPIAAVTFTIEEIVGTLDQSILSGVVVAAALSAVIERGILGVHPVIEVDQPYGLEHASSLLFYAMLGVLAAFVSIAFTDGLLKLRLWFRGFRRVPEWMHPAIGGLVTGVLAVISLRVFAVGGVTGGGYRTLGLALAGHIGFRTLRFLCAAKLAATVFCYSSGGAGGNIAPALFKGAMLGGAVGHADVFVLHHESLELGAFAVVGMGAVFAGIVRAPMTSVLIIFEMTGGYGLVLPLMLANMTAYVLARRMRPTPIYEALLEQDGVVIPHGAAPPVHALDRLCVEDAMTSEVVRVLGTQSIADARSAVARRGFAVLPVVDASETAIGVVPVAQLERADLDATQPITTLMRAGAAVPADAPLLRAVVTMNELSVRHLLVVDAETETRLIGVLTMSDIVRAHAQAAASAKRYEASHRRSERQLELRAEVLMVPAKLAPPTASVRELSEQLRDDAVKALVVDGGAQQLGVILPEYLQEFEHDEELQKILLAADVARPVPCVDERDELPVLVSAMASATVEAVVVLGADAQPTGVVTKSALVSAFFEWYVERLPATPVPPKRPALGLVPR
jgi:CIC family chloride channel protein